MDRCALFVDAGYVLADGAQAVHGTRRRESVSWDYGGLLQLLASQAMERSRLPLLRCYWYEATVEGQRSDDHEALADLPGVKLRVAKMWPGRREGSEIQRDLTTLARNKAVSDAMVVSAEENLAQVISDVQDMGMRVTLLNIAVDGGPGVSRALRQECDDIVEITSAQLRPFVELIPGAEPPRPEEREGALVALRPGANGNGNGNGTANGATNGNGNGGTNGNGNGGTNGNGRGPAGRAVGYAQQSARPGTGQQPTAAGYAAPAGSEYPEYPDYQREPGQPERAESGTAGPGSGTPAAGYPAADYAGADYGAADYQSGGTESVTNAGAEYGSAPDYGQAPEYAAAAPDQGITGSESVPLRPDQGSLRPEAPQVAQERPAAVDPQPGRPDYGVRRVGPRPELAARAEPPARDELYPAPVPIPVAVDDTIIERPPVRPRPDNDLLRPVESGYNPGALREQYQADAMSRDPLASDGADRYQPVPVPVPVPVPANSAQVRRLPARPGQPGSPASRPEPSTGAPSGAWSVAPAAPADARSSGYSDGRGGPYGGPRPIGAGPGGPVRPPAASGPMNTASGPMSTASGPMNFADQQSGGPGQSGQSGQSAPMGLAGQQPMPMPSGPQGPGSGIYPVQNQGPAPVTPVPPGAQAYSGGQSGASLADAVQSAHEEGQAFGESVARDAPALWLEAVLARKPRMPSDLEARLLQGSALPIDFLLHDEVRHALRRGFWDALERARR